MHCQEASELVSLRQDMAIEEDADAGLYTHLLECARCSDEQAHMDRLGALFSHVSMAQPPAMFTQQVMVRVQRHRRWQAFLRGSTVLTLGLLVGLALCLLPFAGPNSPLVRIAESPSLVTAIVSTFVQLVSVVRTLWLAVSLLAGAFLASPGYAGLIGVAVLATLSVVLWLRALSRATALIRNRLP
jgi:predicted anti-sigma-YlaC factor YlaD